MDQVTRPVRLRDGHHLYLGRDGAWRLAAPGDRFTRLRLPTGVGAALAGLIAGTGGTAAAALASAADPAPLRAALDQLDRAGMLSPAARAGPDPHHGRRVAVQGTNPVAEEVVRLLRAAGVGTRRAPEGETLPEDSDALVACAGWLPDSRWRELDRWCAEREVPWHRCHAEGNACYVGPMTVPGATAGYADTRARRLAAAALPDELEAYWAFLDTAKRVPPVPWPDHGVVAVLAGLLVADTLAVLEGRTPPSEGCQLEVDPSRLAVRRHPVLPLPRELMTDSGT